MKSIKFLTLILSIVALSSSWAYAGSNSRSYKVSVTIPAFVGINVPDPNKVSLDTSIELGSEIKNQDITIQEIVRDNERVIAKSITVR